MIKQLLFITLLLVPVYETVACSCGLPPLEDEVKFRQVIFSGQVVGKTTIKLDYRFSDDFTYQIDMDEITFKPSNILKGNESELIIIHTNSDPTTACGFKFKKNTEYLVFSWEIEDERSSGNGLLETNTCARTDIYDPELFNKVKDILIREID